MIKRYLGLLTIAAIAVLTSAAAVVSGTIYRLVEHLLVPRITGWRFLDPTPRSIFQTRRLGLA